MTKQDLEALDFEVAKFNRFTQKVNRFKIWNSIIMGVVGMAIGGAIGAASLVYYQEHQANSLANKFQKLGIKTQNKKSVFYVFTDGSHAQIGQKNGLKYLKIIKGK